MFKGIFSTIFVTLTLSSIAMAQPKISVEEGTTLDFGSAYTGSKVEKILTIRNLGNQPLHITEVKAQCGCTATIMKEEDKTIPPDGKGKVSITFDTHNYGGQKVTKQVFISSNDSSNARLAVSFNVNVLNVLDIAPKFVSFNDSKMESTYTKSVTITNPGKESVKILNTNSVFDQIRIDLMKKDLRPGESTQLQVTFHPTKSGTLQGTIDLETDSKIQPKFSVPVYTWVTRK
jgi:uncharacterized membrane protein